MCPMGFRFACLSMLISHGPSRKECGDSHMSYRVSINLFRVVAVPKARALESVFGMYALHC